MKHKHSSQKKCVNCETFLIHPSKGFEEREEYVKSQLHPIGIEYEHIDTCDAHSDSLRLKTRHWFRGSMLETNENIRSCTAKHLSAYELIVERGLPGALILEDDVTLSNKFCGVFNASIAEYEADETYRDKAVVISYENSRLRFVERSRRIKGKYLYPGVCDRMAAAYYINNAACRLMLDIAQTRKLGLPIDLEHNEALKRGQLTYLWCHPTIITQGSFDGRFASSLSSKKKQFISLRWHLKLAYRRLLYFFR